MSRSYINTKLDSIIAGIIIEGKEGDLSLRIQLRQSTKELQLNDLSFVKSQDDCGLYFVKKNEGYLNDLTTFLPLLEQYGLIDHSFKKFILLNENNEYQKEMKKSVNRRLYECPQNSLIDAVIIQQHDYEDMTFVSHKKDKKEELYRICELNHLSFDWMPSSNIFEDYSIIGSSTYVMALEGLKRAGIIDEQFKDFILSQEESIPVKPIEKEINEEKIALRFDCRYDVIADYSLTSNHRFYQPIHEEVADTFSETIKPKV